MNTNAKFKKIDMTQGDIFKNILLFAIPMVIGNILQYMYTTVDTLVVSKFLGNAALASIGTSSQPVEVLLCIFLGIGTGVSILISQSIGAGDISKVKDLCSTSTFFVYFCGIPLAVIGWFSVPYILKFMAVPADVWDYALIYTRVVFLGSLGNIGYNMNAGILRGLGDSVASLLFLVVSCFVNIVLDIFFVAGLGMNVEGAALATSISVFLSWFVSIIYIKRKFPELDFKVFPNKFVMEDLKKILSIGLPIGLNNSLFSFGHMAIQTMVNSQGSAFMAGNSIAGRLTGITNIAITAFSAAASTFAGQNFGAKNYDRLRMGYLKIPIVSGMITLSFGIIGILVRMPILEYFTQDSQVLMYASRYVICLLLSQWCYAIFNCISNIINGVGFVKYTTVINLLMLWAVRIPSAYIISRYFDGTYLMLCFPISFSFGMICMLAYYAFSGTWHEVINRNKAKA